MKIIRRLTTIAQVARAARLGYGPPCSYFATPIKRRGRWIHRWHLAKNGRGFVIEESLMHELKRGGYMTGWFWTMWTHRFFHTERRCVCGKSGPWVTLQRRAGAQKSREKKTRLRQIRTEITMLNKRIGFLQADRDRLLKAARL